MLISTFTLVIRSAIVAKVIEYLSYKVQYAVSHRRLGGLCRGRTLTFISPSPSVLQEATSKDNIPNFLDRIVRANEYLH